MEEEEDDDNDELFFLLSYDFYVLNTRYLSWGRYRSSAFPYHVFQLDLQCNSDLNWLSEISFQRKYRVSRDGFRMILNLFKNHPVFKKGTRGPPQAPVEYEWMVILNYIGIEGSAASNAKGRDIFHFGEGTVELFRNRVVKAICSLQDNFFKWPDEAERF